MALTTYTEQQAWNILAGSSYNTKFTAQQIINNYLSAAPNTYTDQTGVNTASSKPITASDQQTIFNNVASLLSLSGPVTEYTIQELLNLAITGGLTLAQVIG